jgi:molecular chaperone DnaK (HSP70)
MNIEGRVKKLEDKVKSSGDNEDTLTITGDTIEELTQNAVDTIRKAIRKGQSWDNILLVCPAKLNGIDLVEQDIELVEQDIEKEFGRRPKKIWVIPKEAIPDGW